jgi:hypothetical protein
VFDGLFPVEDDRSIKELIFLLVTWHGYAKLHLHTDTMLEMMETVGTALCQAIRDFATITCPQYKTRELPQETHAHTSRQQEQAKCGKGTRQRKTAGIKDKSFNTATFKLHCIPDYVPTIREYGMTDSYSTQTVSPPISPITCLISHNRANLPIAYLGCGTGYRTKIVATLARSLPKNATDNSMLLC